ncbi:DUF1015 family protein [Actinophytocola sediminis]
MSHWVRPIDRGWIVRDEVPGPDVDEFAEPERIVEALRRRPAGTLLAVQHPHRTPAAIAGGLGLLDALPAARSTLSVLLRTAYRAVSDVVAPYEVDGPDGTACGLLCMVDPAAVDAAGLGRIRHSEQVYPEIVAERAEVLAGLGHATSAAMLVPVGETDTLTAALRLAVAGKHPEVSTVDSEGRRHRLWLLGSGQVRDTVLAEASAYPLMVADGNHRVAAAATAGLSGLLAMVTAGPALRIGAYHRVLVGTGLTAADLATAWRRAGLTVDDPAGADPTPGTTVVHCPQGTLRVRLPDQGPDHAVLEEVLLRGAIGIDPEGPNVRPLPAGRQPPADADAVFLLAPVPLATVRAVHAAGDRMPRKSTYFTPKPRSGLLLAELGGRRPPQPG